MRRSPVGFDLRSLVDLLLDENFTHPAAQPNSQTARSRSGHRENPRDDDDDEGEDFVYDNSAMDELESWWSVERTGHSLLGEVRLVDGAT